MITSLKNRIIQIRIIIFVFTAVILTAIIHIVSYPPLLTPGITGDETGTYKGVAHITFHSIDELKINPVLSPEEVDRKISEMQETGEHNTIFHYGLRIYHDKPIETVTIRYSYFGIPLSHTLNVK
jgi:hypothetical protein